MITYDEFKEAVDSGYIVGPTVGISRKEGKIYDYALPGEKIQDWEVIVQEEVVAVLEELLKAE